MKKSDRGTTAAGAAMEGTTRRRAKAKKARVCRPMVVCVFGGDFEYGEDNLMCWKKKQVLKRKK